MAKIFIDVGAHTGETLEAAMDPRWGFDRIYSFEPAPSCWPSLHELADERVEILPFGLWTEDARLELHDPGLIEASLVTPKGKTTSNAVQVEVRDAARWFAETIRADDEVIVKINCEGAECDLLEHLLEHGELAKVDELLVHFDVRKIPGLHHRELPTRQRLEQAGISYHLAESILFGSTVQEMTTNWLSWYHAPRWARFRFTVVRRTVRGLDVRLSLLGRELGLNVDAAALDDTTGDDVPSGTPSGSDPGPAGLGRWLIPSEAVARLVRRSYQRTRKETPMAFALGHLTRYRLARRWDVVLHPSAQVGDVRFVHPASIVIGAGVVIEDGVVLHRGVTLEAADGGGAPGSPVVRRNAQILEGATVLGGVEIGEGAIVAAGSLVLVDVAPETIVAGTPAQVIDAPLGFG